MFNEVVIVEGKNDESHLKEIYPDIETISVNGSEISEDSKKTIIEISKRRSIILFFDPDYPGQRIRTIISNLVPNAKHAFLKRNVCFSKNGKKIGVEHASKKNIIEALSHVITPTMEKGNLKMIDLYNLGLVGNKNLRNKVSYSLNIGYNNCKTMLKRLNMIGINYKELKDVVDENR